MLTAAELKALEAVLLRCSECGSEDVYEAPHDGAIECNACGAIESKGVIWANQDEFQHWLDAGGDHEREGSRKTARTAGLWEDMEQSIWGDGPPDPEPDPCPQCGKNAVVEIKDYEDGEYSSSRECQECDWWDGKHEGSRKTASEVTWTVSPEDSGVYVSEPINGLVGVVEASDVVSTTADYDLPTRNTWLWSVEEDESGRTVATGKSAFEGSARQQAEEVMRGGKKTGSRLSAAQLRTLALGETMVPGEVDTLRDDACPICGSNDYRGDTCNSCGFARPPVIFHDPDVEKAKIEDLRTPAVPVALACDNCGAVYPANTTATTPEDQVATATAILRRMAKIPQAPPLGQGSTTDATSTAVDPTAEATTEPAPAPTPEPVKPAPTEVTPEQGSLCPSCGKGTLLPKDEVNGIEADQAAGAIPQNLDVDPSLPTSTDAAPAGGGAKDYTILPKDDPEALLNLVKGGGQVTASRRTALAPDKKRTKAPTAPKAPEAPDAPEAPKATEAPEVEVAPPGQEPQDPQADVTVDVEAEPEDADVEVTEEAPEEQAPEEQAPEGEQETPELGDGVVDEETDVEMGRGGLGRALMEGGFSMRDPSGVGPQGGYMVALDKGSEAVFPLDSTTSNDIASYFDKYQPLLADPNKYLGGWVEDGQLYLDISTNIEDVEQARAKAAENDQIAIWDVAGGTSIYTQAQKDEMIAAAVLRSMVLARRMASRPVSGPYLGQEEMEAHGLRRLAGRSQKEKSMSTTPQRRAPQDHRASRQPENPRQLLHATAKRAEAAFGRAEALARLVQAQAKDRAKTDKVIQALTTQNEMLRSALLSLSEAQGSPEALRATASLRKAAEQGGAKNGEEVALTDDAAAAPEARVDVEAPGSVSSEANDNVTPDATTDLENTQVAEDQGALNQLVEVTEEHTQTGNGTGTTTVLPSAPASSEVSNPIEESGWKTSAVKDTQDPGSLRTWAAMNLAQVRKTAGVTDEETLVLAQRIEGDETISVEAMEIEINALNKVVAAKTAAQRPAPRNLVPRAATPAGSAPSLATTAGRDEQPGDPTTVDLGDTIAF